MAISERGVGGRVAHVLGLGGDDGWGLVDRISSGAFYGAAVGALAAGGPDRIVYGLRASGLVAAVMLVGAVWLAARLRDSGSSPNYD